MAKCLQRGHPACPVLYEEYRYISVPRYVWIHEVEGTMVLQTMERWLVGYDERLHIHLHQCLLGEDHAGGHLTEIRGSRFRWWPEESDG
jgi:hypothetical protein